MGSYNKLYSAFASNTQVAEIDWQNGCRINEGWWVNPYTWTPPSLYSCVVVNRVDHLLAAAGLSGAWYLHCWRNIDTTPELFGKLTLPAPLSYLAYESRNYCWGITKDGVIVKADYQIPRWEMISKVKNPTEDTKDYRITFDTKRKRVVVFRWREDAADGACQSQLEFYYPMVEATQLTKPVPVTSLRAGNRILLVSHLIGEAGEGVTPYTVEGELLEPVAGRLVKPFAGTELNGRVCFQYQAPYQAVTETLSLSVEVEET